jgi:hypothetical protein
MSSVACPSCGLSFETAATTNTRCRRCRKVVNIGRTPRVPSTNRADHEYQEASGDGWALAVLGVAAAFIFWLFRRE